MVIEHCSQVRRSATNGRRECSVLVPFGNLVMRAYCRLSLAAVVG